MGLFTLKSSKEEDLLIKDEPATRSLNYTSEDNGQKDNHKDPAPEKEETKQNTCAYVLGYFFLLLGILCVSFGQMFAQALDESIPHSQLNGFRYSAQFVLTVNAMACVGPRDVRFDKKLAGWVLLGSVAATLASYAIYGAVYYLPLGTASGIATSLILLITFILNIIIHRKVNKGELVAAILCIIGIPLVTQPPFLFAGHTFAPVLAANNNSYHFPCGHHKYVNDSRVVQTIHSNTSLQVGDEDNLFDTRLSHEKVVGYMLTCLMAISATSHIKIVRYKISDLDFLIYNFWNSLFGSISSFIIMGIMETPVWPNLSVCIVFMLGHMFLSGAQNIFLTRGFQLSSTIISALMFTLSIPINFILQYTVMSSLLPGHANVLEIIGAALVFAGNVFVPLLETIQWYRSRS